MRHLYPMGSGEYSNHETVAVFPTVEQAQAAADLANRIAGDEPGSYGAARVEAPIPYFDGDLPLEALKIQQQFYRPGKQLEDGTWEHQAAWIESYPDRPASEERVGEWALEHSSEARAYLVHNSGYWFWLKVEGTNPERVRRVFSDRRAELMAQPWIAMTVEQIAATTGIDIGDRW